MAIPKFTKLTTTACPLNIENVDTDQIIPARFLKAVERKGFGDNLFRDWRYDKAGNKVDSFPLNDPKFGGEILVAAKNFGCGSSREHAPVAIKAAGIDCVIAKSFARIFYRNAINIGLPILECPAASEAINEGDVVAINFDTGVITDETTGQTFQAAPFPPFIQKIIKAGGLMKSIQEGK